MDVIILAAGRGTRLLPLTTNRPKVLLDVGGKPILKWQLDELLELDSIGKIIIVLNYAAELVISEVKSWTNDPRIAFVLQKETNGTGDAVLTGLREINPNTSFLVINGDVLLEGSIKQMANSGLDAAILGAKVDNPSLYGVLQNDGNRLISLIEKPTIASRDSQINAGLYIFPPQAVELFAKLENSERGEKELTDVIQQLLDQSVDIEIISNEGKWFDLGHPWHILNANEYLLDKYQDEFEILGTVENGATLIGNVHVAKSARVRSGVYIEGPVYIDEGADIGPNCYIRSRSYLGKNVRVGNACEIKNSLLYRETHAAHLSYVGDSIIGECSNLGAGTITANLRHDGGNIKMGIKDQRVDSMRRKLGVVMGDNVKIGINVSILPGVKIDSGSWLNAHDFITRDVINKK